MRIPSGKTDVQIYFVAKDSEGARLTGLSSFSVTRSRNGGADVAFTSPSITEIDSSTMPGVYALLVDEDTTLTPGAESEELCLHITHAGMEPVTRTIELYRGEHPVLGILSSLIEEYDTDLYRFTADALSEAPTGGGGGGPTASEIADAVWDEARGDHSTAGSFGEALQATVGSRASQASVDDLPTNAELAAALDAADDAVLSAISNLNDISAADVWGHATRTLTALDEDDTTLDIDGAVRAAVGLAAANLDAQIGDLPTNAELAAALAAADDAVLAAIGDLNDITAADVWGHATRELTSGNGIVLAKGTGITGLNDLDAAGVRAAVGLASANLDTQLGDLPTNAELAAALAAADDAVLAQVALVKAKTDLLPSAPASTGDVTSARDAVLAAVNAVGDELDNAAIADAVWTRAIEDVYTAEQIMRGVAAYAMGEWTKTGSRQTYKGLDGETDRLAADLSSSSRSNLTRDLD